MTHRDRYIPAYEFYLRKAVNKFARENDIQVVNYFIVEDQGDTKIVQVDEVNFKRTFTVEMRFDVEEKLIGWKILREKTNTLRNK